MNLPNHYNLPIPYLVAAFKSSRVTNSYKFYWFLAILELIEKHNQSKFSFQEIALQMIANVWYPINYYYLSLGKQDMLASVIEVLSKELRLSKDIQKTNLIATLKANLYKPTIANQVQKILNFVPYRFLSSWFTKALKGQKDHVKNRLIITLAQKHFTLSEHTSLYRFEQNTIEIQPSWFTYLLQHLAILKDFCYWHLINYLQRNNPNVPNIATKLFEPKTRNLHKAKTFWKNYLQVKQHIPCIYSSTFLTDKFSVDHFLPWSFVAHDQLWNLTPTTKSINSSKSDNLPALSTYFSAFATLQFDAFLVNYELGKTKLLEDYVLLLRESEATISQFEPMIFEQKLSEHITPLLQIATNLGFTPNWLYNPKT